MIAGKREARFQVPGTTNLLLANHPLALRCLAISRLDCWQAISLLDAASILQFFRGVYPAHSTFCGLASGLILERSTNQGLRIGPHSLWPGLSQPRGVMFCQALKPC
jgi:hypothetical protein